ncbi:hypothetical protein VNO80_05778 [Phaseolus coccineus]|uniref:C2H2-type domain-containing protein n=1 Tax=Phaseolus coccineus TaxID=3886 RepID=A0AAN9NGP0_PHACN
MGENREIEENETGKGRRDVEIIYELKQNQTCTTRIQDCFWGRTDSLLFAAYGSKCAGTFNTNTQVAPFLYVITNGRSKLLECALIGVDGSFFYMDPLLQYIIIPVKHKETPFWNLAIIIFFSASVQHLIFACDIMGSHYQYWMHVRREQIMNSHSHKAPIIGDVRKNNWEERAFAEDATRRSLGGSMWPPRSYSCIFCKREFRSAQALGGHMNIHRRDRARLKQNLRAHHNYEPFSHHYHHENDDSIQSLLGNNHHFSAPVISTQLNCGLTHAHNYSSQATTISTTRSLSCISTQETCGRHKFSPSSSSFILGQMGSPNSEQEREVKAKEYNFKGLGCSNFVETSLSVGLTSMFGQNSSPIVPCGDRPKISCKRLKNTISSLPLFLRPCSKDKGLAFQPVEISLGLDHGIEDLDLELRLGKQHNVK